MYKILGCNKIIPEIIDYYKILISDRLKQSITSVLFCDKVLQDRLVVKYYLIKDKSNVIVESRSRHAMPNITGRSRPQTNIPPASKFSTFYNFAKICKSLQTSDLISGFCKNVQKISRG